METPVQNISNERSSGLALGMDILPIGRNVTEPDILHAVISLQEMQSQ